MMFTDSAVGTEDEAASRSNIFKAKLIRFWAKGEVWAKSKSCIPKNILSTASLPTLTPGRAATRKHTMVGGNILREGGKRTFGGQNIIQ